jgi:hypothetical protein
MAHGLLLALTRQLMPGIAQATDVLMNALRPAHRLAFAGARIAAGRLPKLHTQAKFNLAT